MPGKAPIASIEPNGSSRLAGRPPLTEIRLSRHALDWGLRDAAIDEIHDPANRTATKAQRSGTTKYLNTVQQQGFRRHRVIG